MLEDSHREDEEVNQERGPHRSKGNGVQYKRRAEEDPSRVGAGDPAEKLWGPCGPKEQVGSLPRGLFRWWGSRGSPRRPGVPIHGEKVWWPAQFGDGLVITTQPNKLTKKQEAFSWNNSCLGKKKQPYTTWLSFKYYYIILIMIQP